MPKLEPLLAGHAADVLAFEQANRVYFSSSISDRGQSFFEELDERLAALLSEQHAGVCAFYLLIDDGSLLGRFNLYDLQEFSAEVGYRVAQHVAGNGVETAALGQLCRVAQAQHGLHTLKASTSHENVASQRVLAKTGFLPVGPAAPADLGGKPGTRYQLTLTLPSALGASDDSR